MDREQQNLAWKCLPKAARDEIRNIVKDGGMGIHGMFDLVFGGNVTSDTEPEEMLCVNKEAVENYYKLLDYNYSHDSELYDDLYWGFAKLFPDISNTPNSGELESESADKEEQAKPKFKVGDKVRAVSKPLSEYCVAGEITYFNESNGLYTIDNQWGFLESELEPYTEDKNEESESEEIYNRYFPPKNDMEEKINIKELFTKENIDEIVSSMLEYTAVITQDVITEASKYKPEEERMFIKGAAWMLYHLVKNRGQRHIYIESDMSLDEAIQHCEEVLPLAETAQCAREHVQLRDWLTELKQRREERKENEIQ